MRKSRHWIRCADIEPRFVNSIQEMENPVSPRVVIVIPGKVIHITGKWTTER